ATMLTGLDPSVHGCLPFPSAPPLAENYVTLPEVLAAAGFRTAAFTGGGYVSASFGFQQGFQSFRSYGHRFEDNLPAVRGWLTANAEQRFFLFLHGFNVHGPYDPPPPYDTMFSDGHRVVRQVGPLRADQPRPPADELQFVISQYDGEIRWVDSLVGELLAEL